MFPNVLVCAPFPKGRACGRGGETLVICTITVAGLAHELQKERDLPGVFIGDPSSGPQDVIVQRQAVLARVRQRLAGLDADRQAIDAPRPGLADPLGSSARLADNS
jgi:hypothetical protein